MKREEILAIKLNMIYDKLINIGWEIEKQKLEKRKVELKNEIEHNQRELQEIDMISNDYWNRKEQMMRDFNIRESTVESER